MTRMTLTGYGGISNWLLICILMGAASVAYPGSPSAGIARIPLVDSPTSSSLLIVLFTESHSFPAYPPMEHGENLDEYELRLPGIPVILAIWDSGRVVWSENHTWGGPPYFESLIDIESVETLLGEIESKAADLSIPAYSRRNVLEYDHPKSRTIIRCFERVLTMETGFEFAESRNQSSFVTASGNIRSLSDGETQETALNNEPLEYKQLRMFWSFCRKEILALISKTNGRPVERLRFREWGTMELMCLNE